jgi:hypothetical protein
MGERISSPSFDRPVFGHHIDGMSPAKLEALRRKYANIKGAEIFDPVFAAVAASAFIDHERRK